MSYYAGYHGVACYLSIEDFEDFMKSYFKLHPDLTEEEREDLDPAENENIPISIRKHSRKRMYRFANSRPICRFCGLSARYFRIYM